MKKRLLSSALIIITGIFTAVFAQDKGNEASADRTLRGSGRVNASTLGMEFDLPLGAYPGRGINVPISLSYSSKVWRMDYIGQTNIPGSNSSPCLSQYFPEFAEESASGWTSSLAVPYIEYIGAETRFNYKGEGATGVNIECPSSGGGGNGILDPDKYVKRILVHLPGGETHELRVDDDIVSFYPTGNSDPNGPYQASMWNATYYAADSSNLKYIQNSATNTYRLLMPDGSFYDFDAATPHGVDRKAVKFTDRNGNFTTYYPPNSVDEYGVTHPNGYWKDTLGRNLSIPLGLKAPTTPTTANEPQIYKMPGMTGEYKLQWKQLKGGSAAESGLTNFSDNLKYSGDRYAGNPGACNNTYPTFCYHPAGTFLFSGGDDLILSPTVFNPIVLTEIELPTGQKYEFKYDIYGRIERIKYPTGGEERFQYAVVPTLSMLEPGEVGGNTNFGVVNRKVYKSANDTSPYEWTYSANYVTQQAGYQVNINNPDGTRIERFLHRGYGTDSNLGKFGFDNGLAGMAYEERVYDGSTPQKLVTKKLTTWAKSPFSISETTYTQPDGYPYTSNVTTHWHSRVTREENIIYDALGTGISATTIYGYEDETNLNQRNTPVLTKTSSQYAFVTAGSSLPSSPLRTSETTFLINDQSYPQWVREIYKNQNMIGLVSSSLIKDGAGTIVSRSEMKYDDGSSSPALGRGNPTSLRVWDNTKGNYDNPNAYITTYAKFDQWGNQYETTDANGNTTSTAYDSVYHAFPVQVTSAVPDPTNTNGSNTAFVTTATFDTVTGLPLTTVDANGLESRIEYDWETLRVKKTKTFYNNQQIGSESETIYHDETGNYWIKNRAQIDVNKWAESITYFDGLGRAYKSEEVNSEGNIFVEKEFDAEGRVKRVTNPFRANETKQWTTNVYDEASRIKEVILPDGAKVKTDYGVSASGITGVTKQITDQAGKKRKGISDALGRMIRVIEDPDNTNLNTDYVFDTLGNLRKTIQGEQSRYFTYDSLGRLLYAKQPEQEANTSFSFTDPITNNSNWSVKYEYDDNGNIVSTTDARGVSVTGTYDNLNRLKKRDYSDTTADVDFYYDGRGLPSVPDFSKGKTTKVASSVSETRYTSFDNLGRLLSSEQRTPFADETPENAAPRVSTYQYNLTALVSQTYPSGRTVKTDYDTDGDVASVWGTVGSTNRLYANAIHYNSSGAIERLRLGNGKWETAEYNNRQQITEIGLGSSADDKSLLKLEYGYGDNTQNNGLMRNQKISFNGLAQPFEQIYTYDNLNRLKSAAETVNSSQTWKQTFNYDRYGNRTFDANNTTTLAQSNNLTNPQIDTATNRFSSGQNYLYDKSGNLTGDPNGNQFLYDAENHQTEIKNSQNQTIGQYLYDGEGKRVKKISSTEVTIFVYDGTSQLVAEYSTQITQTPQVSYLTTDHLGSPRVITNQNGQVTTRKDYMAFGEETYSQQRTSALKYGNQSETRKGYTGYEKDAESGLDFAQARYYNSQHGRFTSVDPLTASATIRNPQTFNRYSYVLNSPYKFTDPLGLLSVDTTGACGGWCRNSSSYGVGVIPFDDNSWTVHRLPERGVINPPEPPPPPPPPPSSDDVEPESTNSIVLEQNKSLAELFTDEEGIVRSTRNDPEVFFSEDSTSHFRFAKGYPDGQIFGVHVYGDESGNTNANVYVPEYYDDVRYIGGNDNTVRAYNTKTGERIDFYHISGVSSQKQLDKNMKKQNKAGSRLIGQTGGKNGDGPGYKHACIRTFMGDNGYTKYQEAQNGANGKKAHPVESSAMGDLRKLFKK